MDLLGYELADIIVTAIGSIGLWLLDSRRRKKATLYYPLFFACDGIMRSIQEDELITPDQRRNLFEESVKTLDKLIYEYGTIIYLKSNLKDFYVMKQNIEENRYLFDKDNWEFYKRIYKDEVEFKDFINTTLATEETFGKILQKANNLRDLCKNNQSSLKNLEDSIITDKTNNGEMN